MKNAVTKKQRIRSKIDELLRQNEKFITWDMLDICPHWIDKNRCVNYKLLSYEGHIVFKYMKELDIKFIRYSDKIFDKKIHGNNKGFYYDIKEIRKRKIESIMMLNQN